MKTEFDMEISNLPAELYGNLIQQKIRDSVMPWQLAEHWAYICTELCQKALLPLGDVPF